jgi:NADH-quinone oxidoreductase subunit J
MISNFALFVPLALIAIASAVGMLLSRSAIYSALNLIVNFGTVAVFYLILGAPFIALAQITVYAGAIMVLFLFVIMLLGAERLRAVRRYGRQETIALIAGLILVVEAAYVLFFRPTSGTDYASIPASYGSATGIGLELFNQYLLPFEVTSVLLLVAMIGAIILTRRRKTNVTLKQP